MKVRRTLSATADGNGIVLAEELWPLAAAKPRAVTPVTRYRSCKLNMRSAGLPKHFVGDLESKHSVERAPAARQRAPRPRPTAAATRRIGLFRESVEETAIVRGLGES